MTDAPLAMAGEGMMQPLTANSILLNALKEQENWDRANKVMADLDYYVLRSASNIARSMSILDKQSISNTASDCK